MSKKPEIEYVYYDNNWVIAKHPSGQYTATRCGWYVMWCGTSVEDAVRKIKEYEARPQNEYVYLQNWMIVKQVDGRVAATHYSDGDRDYYVWGTSVEQVMDRVNFYEANPKALKDRQAARWTTEMCE